MRTVRPTSTPAPLRRAIFRRAALVGMVALLWSCGDSEPGVGRSEDAIVPPAPSRGDEMRIASLSPAITECLVELGLGECIVGRTPWCDTGSERVPVVGTLLDADVESLVRCAPTMVVVQPPAQGIDPAIDRLASVHGWPVHAWRIEGLEDVRAAMRGMADAAAAASASRAAEVRDRHRRWEARLDASLAPIPDSGAPEGTPGVLVVMGGVEGIAFGRGSYVDDALARFGVRNALERPGYPTVGMEDIVRLSPALVVVVGGRDTGAVPEGILRGVTVVRVESRGLAVPGGRLPDGLMALRGAVEGARAAAVEARDGR